MFLVTNVASLDKLIYMEEIDFRDIVTYLFMTRCNKLSLEHDLNCVYIGSVVMCCLLSTRNRVVFTVGNFITPHMPFTIAAVFTVCSRVEHSSVNSHLKSVLFMSVVFGCHLSGCQM